jgi:hypothetical protein
MPRWISENNDPRRDLLGFPVTQTRVIDSSKATVIEGASQQEELEAQLRQAAHNLQRFNKQHPVIHTQGKLPPGAILATDFDEERRELMYIGYRLEKGSALIRFIKPFPCRPPSP